MQPSLLEKELAEIHNYLRHCVQILLTWYTFFVTVNVLTLGWFASRPSQGQSIGLGYCILVVTGFVFAIVLGLFACHHGRAYLGATAARTDEILHILASGDQSDQDQPQSPLPLQLYGKVITAVQLSLYAAILSWCVVLGINI